MSIISTIFYILNKKIRELCWIDWKLRQYYINIHIYNGCEIFAKQKNVFLVTLKISHIVVTTALKNIKNIYIYIHIYICIYIHDFQEKNFLIN